MNEPAGAAQPSWADIWRSASQWWTGLGVKSIPAPLVGILLLGLLLRVIGLSVRALQYDDVFSIFLAKQGLSAILAGTAADTMPPLYFYFLHFWMIVSQEVWFIRLLSVLLSLGVVTWLYALVNHLAGRSAANWAALLAAVSPLQIYHAQDVRMYALLVLAQTGYLYFFARLFIPPAVFPLEGAKPTHRKAVWVGLILCGTAAMYSHNVAVFGLASANVYLLLRRDWKGEMRLLCAQSLIGLFALPWLLLLPGQIAKVQHAWSLPRPGLIEILQAILMFTASLPLPFILLAVAAVLSLQLWLMTLLEAWKARRIQSPGLPNSLLLLVCILFVPPVLLFGASYLVKPMFIPRAFLIASLAYDGLAGLVIALAWSRGVGKVIAATFLLAAAISLPSFYTFDSFPRSPYQQAASSLLTQVQPGSLIVHENKLSYFPMHFYQPDLPQVFVDDITGSENDTFEVGSQEAMKIYPQADLPTAVGNSQDVYYILFTETYDEYRALGLAEHPDQVWLGQHFRQVGKQVFNDLEIDHYQR